MEDDARGYARAAVGDEVALRQLRQRLRPRGVAGTGDPARRRVDEVRLPAPAVRRARVDEHELGVGEPAREILGDNGVLDPRLWHERGRLDLLLAFTPGPAPGVDAAHEHGAVVVSEVPQKPPEALGAAERAVGDDVDTRADPRTRRGGSEAFRRRERVTPFSGHGHV